MVSANGVCRLSSSPLFRCMSWRHSSSKLFVGVKVICDHKSGKSKGYGFVHFMSEDSASKALVEMDGQLLDSRNIRIQYANKK